MAGLIMPWAAGMLGGLYIEPLTGGYIDGGSTGTNTSSYSFSNISLGSLPSTGQRRYIIVSNHHSGDSLDGTVPNSVTVAGSGATLIRHETQTSGGGGGSGTGLFIIENNVNTTATLAMSLPYTASRGGLRAWAVYSGSNGLSVAANYGAKGTSSSDLTITGVSVNAGDVMIVAAGTYNGGSFTFGGGYVSGTDFMNNLESSNWHGGISKAEAVGVTGQTISCTATVNCEQVIAVLRPD